MADKKSQLPAQKRVKVKQEEMNLKPIQRNCATEVSKAHDLPRHLVNTLMGMNLVTYGGDSVEDRAILNFITSVRNNRKFARFVMSAFSRAELENIFITKGLDNLEVIIYNILKANKKISTKAVLEILAQTRAISASRVVRDKIMRMRKRVQNERNYENNKKLLGGAKEQEQLWQTNERKSHEMGD